MAISKLPSLSLPSALYLPPPYSVLHVQGHSPVYSSSCLLFLVTVTMFAPGLLITYLSVVLKKAQVSCVEEASGIRIPVFFFLYFLESHYVICSDCSQTPTQPFLSLSLSAVRPWTAVMAQAPGKSSPVQSVTVILLSFSHMFLLYITPFTNVNKDFI